MIVCNNKNCTHMKAQLAALMDNTRRKIVIVLRDGTNSHGQRILTPATPLASGDYGGGGSSRASSSKVRPLASQLV